MSFGDSTKTVHKVDIFNIKFVLTFPSISVFGFGISDKLINLYLK